VTSLDLGLIGNGTIGALLNPTGDIVWACFPRFDGDPAFCSLLREQTRDTDFGCFAVELGDFVRAEQEYLVNTAILLTRTTAPAGASRSPIPRLASVSTAACSPR